MKAMLQFRHVCQYILAGQAVCQGTPAGLERGQGQGQLLGAALSSPYQSLDQAQQWALSRQALPGQQQLAQLSLRAADKLRCLTTRLTDQAWRAWLQVQAQSPQPAAPPAACMQHGLLCMQLLQLH